MSDDTFESGSDIVFRKSTVDDGPTVWRLAFDTRALEDNKG